MYEALQGVITTRKHRTVFRAMLSQFEEEINYTLETHSLHLTCFRSEMRLKTAYWVHPARTSHLEN